MGILHDESIVHQLGKERNNGSCFGWGFPNHTTFCRRAFHPTPALSSDIHWLSSDFGRCPAETLQERVCFQEHRTAAWKCPHRWSDKKIRVFGCPVHHRRSKSEYQIRG